MRSSLSRADPNQLQIHDSVPHAVMAVTRHVNTFVYYADNGDDSINRFIARAMDATTTTILEHGLKVSIYKRDTTVARAVLRMLNTEARSVEKQNTTI